MAVLFFLGGEELGGSYCSALAPWVTESPMRSKYFELRYYRLVRTDYHSLLDVIYGRLCLDWFVSLQNA